MSGRTGIDTKREMIRNIGTIEAIEVAVSIGRTEVMRRKKILTEGTDLLTRMKTNTGIDIDGDTDAIERIAVVMIADTVVMIVMMMRKLLMVLMVQAKDDTIVATVANIGDITREDIIGIAIKTKTGTEARRRTNDDIVVATDGRMISTE